MVHLATRAGAQEFAIQFLAVPPDQQKIVFNSEPTDYFILLKGGNPSQISKPVDITLGKSGSSEFRLTGTAASDSAGFYRVRRIPISEPLDTDGDGLDDVTELRNPNVFDPLNGKDGILTRIQKSSPFHGEAGIAVTRETVVHFSQPLAAKTVLTPTHFYAGYAGRRLLSRIELSGDRSRATLFYLEPLPGGSRISVVFDGTGISDASGRPVDPDGDGLAGGMAVIQFDTLNLLPTSGTAVVGQVFASELVAGTDTGTNAVNRPLAGVTITVDGMEQSLRAVTDGQGRFTLKNCPAGRFFVHMDGRTVSDVAAGIHYPDKAYYPYVGKAWDAVAGRSDNKAGGTGVIYLPLIPTGTLQKVSATVETTIGFPADVLRKNPALEGVGITVPANSLFSDNGTRGGSVGIAPVPPDRLPGPLPPGLEMPIVITVQTDGGSNFEQPAGICFPNLPDPVLKAPLPPGSRQSLISFDHDKGIWEAVGTMTVSEDGKRICTDPGQGILQPGWHGVGPIPVGCPPADIPPKCPKASHKECRDDCYRQLDACRQWALQSFEDSMRYCEEGNPGPCFFEGNPSPCPQPSEDCEKEAARRLRQERKDCPRAFNECLKKCDACTDEEDADGSSASRVRGSARPAGPEDDEATLVQLEAIYDEILRVLEPHISSPDPLPLAIKAQVRDLRRQAAVIAGGSLNEFLTRTILANEIEAAAFASQVGVGVEDLQASNQPAEPVQYVARIARPDDTMVLHGTTGPNGQYALFVPRDGRILDMSFYDPRTKNYATLHPYLNPTARYGLPRFFLRPLEPDEVDSDADAMVDVIEEIYGTDPRKSDTDGDGVGDATEIQRGSNPLDGVPVGIGIVGAVATPGVALAVSADGNLLAVAEGSSGVSMFDVSKGMNPVLIRQVDTPGAAQSVAVLGERVAVADGNQGLALLDVSDRPNARILRQVPVGGIVQSVVMARGLAYVGAASGVDGLPGFVAKIMLSNGSVLGQWTATDAVDDVALSGDFLYILSRGALHVLRDVSAGFEEIGSISLPSNVSTGETGRKLFVGGGLAYVGYFGGYLVLDVSVPTKPVIIGLPPAAQLGLRSTAASGSGLLVATTSFAPPNIRQVALYDVSNPTDVRNFVTLIDTPGEAFALTIHNGLSYVADGTAGIEVVNFAAPDSRQVPPIIRLESSSVGKPMEAGSWLRATAATRDDVQVREVEFYMDGSLVRRDGSFPFEDWIHLPPRTESRTNIVLRARAVDNGGNGTWSDELTVSLLADSTPPMVVSAEPASGARTVNRVTVGFSEDIVPSSLNQDSFTLTGTGPDGVFDTPDDQKVSGALVNYLPAEQVGVLELAAPLPVGLYRGRITQGVMDPAGNHLPADFAWSFRVADAVFWVSRRDGRWEDPENWSEGAVPGELDAVVLDIPSQLSVVHSTGTHAVRSLSSTGSLKVLGGTLTVAGSVSIDQLLGVSGGLFRGASLKAGGGVELTGGTMEVSGVIELAQPFKLNGGQLKSATLQQQGAARLICALNDANVIDGVQIAGNLSLTNLGARLQVRNGLKLGGELRIDNSGGISFVGNQTLDNTTIVFGSVGGFLGVSGNATLTLGPNTVVRGKTAFLQQGVFFGPNDRLVNQGLISADIAGGTFTIRPSQFENRGRIEGKNGGSLKMEPLNWVNAAAVDSSGGGELTLGGSWSNTGSIRIDNVTLNLGGTFQLANLGTIQRTAGSVNLTGVLDLEGGTLPLDANTGSWTMRGGTLKNGTLSQKDDGKLLFAFNDANTFDGVSVVGDLDLATLGGRLQVRNGLAISGNVLIDNSGGISFVGNQTLDNTTIVFGSVGGFLGVSGNATLTLGPKTVVRGTTAFLQQGVFFGPNDRLVNQGLISADVAGGTFTIRPSQFENRGRVESKNGGSLKMEPLNWLNASVVDASGGGELTLGGTWQNTGSIRVDGVTLNLGGTFQLANIGTIQRTAGSVNLTGVLDLGGGTLPLDANTGSWTLRGGTLKNGTMSQKDDGKLLFASNDANNFDGVSVVGNLDLTSLGARLQVRNGLAVSGDVLIDNSGGLSFVGTQILDQTTVVFGTTGGFLGVSGNATLTLGPNTIVRGKNGNLQQGVFLGPNDKLVNQGRIAADVAGGTINVRPSQFENLGTLRADGDGAKLIIRTTPFTNGGVIEELSGGKVLINP